MSIFFKTILATCLAAFSIISAQAQSYSFKDNEKKNPERYLSGAVPEVDGKVVFSETVQTNHSAAEIIEMIEKWAESKNKTDNKFYNSKTTYNDTLKHELALLINDRLIFTSQALSLDYALITYYLIVEASNNQCAITLKNIKYKYVDFKNPVTADEMISDEVALNKEKTKMYRTYDKFRVTTIDMAENNFDEIEKVLNKEEYDAVKNASKTRRENNIQTAPQTTASIDESATAQTPQVKASVVENAVAVTEPATIPMIPLTPPTTVSTNATVLAAQKTISQFARQKAWAASNYFIVGENIAYVRQVSALSVEEIDGKASIVCYINNDGTMLSQSQIMPSGKFKILYYTPNYGSYNQLVELSRKYANNEAYSDTDISMIEVLLENSKDAFRINHLKIETVPTSTISNQPSIDSMPTIGNYIKTDKCVVITGSIVD